MNIYFLVSVSPISYKMVEIEKSKTKTENLPSSDGWQDSSNTSWHITEVEGEALPKRLDDDVEEDDVAILDLINFSEIYF